jgi:hypothetical protein
MNTSPTSAAQQDRIGQHQNAQARRHANPAGQSQGVGFAQLLSSAGAEATADDTTEGARATRRGKNRQPPSEASETPAGAGLDIAALAQSLLGSSGRPSGAPSQDTAGTANPFPRGSQAGMSDASTATPATGTEAATAPAVDDGLVALGNTADTPASETDLAAEAAATDTPAAQHGHGQASKAGARATAVGRLVSAAARDDSIGSPPPQTMPLSVPTGDEAARLGAWHMAQPGQPGSALASGTLKGERTAPEEESTVGGAFASAVIDAKTTPSANAGASGGGHNPLMSGDSAPLEGPPPSADSSTAAPEAFAQSLGQAMGDAFEQMGAQVGYWAARGVQRATLQVQAGLGERIDVDVSLRNGEARLEFWADNPLTRTAIAEHAPGALAEMLARQGIGLGGLSVSTQQRQGRGDEAAHGAERGLGRTRPTGRPHPLQDLAQLPAVRSTLAGGVSQRALDVFV